MKKYSVTLKNKPIELIDSLVYLLASFPFIYSLGYLFGASLARGHFAGDNLGFVFQQLVGSLVVAAGYYATRN